MKKTDYDFLHKCKYLNRLMERDFNNRLALYDLTCQQGHVLFQIICAYDTNSPIHQNDIEKNMHLSKATVSGLVKRLESKSLIQKEQSGNSYLLTPTEEGINLRKKFREERMKMKKNLLKGFTSEEEKLLDELLTKMIQNFNKETNY